MNKNKLVSFSLFLDEGGKKESRKVLYRYTYLPFIFLGEEVGCGLSIEGVLWLADSSRRRFAPA